MANEAVIIELLGNRGDPISFTVANATGVEKGTLMRLQTPRTAVASSGVTGVFAGIAAAEKVASDGATQLALHTYGIFDLLMATGSACKEGDSLVMSGTNAVARAVDAPGGTLGAVASGMILGKALEDGSSAEVIAVLVGA